MSIELGGGIALEGFDDVEGAELVVVKKLVGRYARKISDANDDYKGLKLTLEDNEKDYRLSASAEIGDREESVEVTEDNLFVGMDSVLKKLIDTI